MFLNQLTPAEKEAFVSLAVHAANANGIIEDTEYDMLEEYCKEMGITFFDAKNIIDMDRIVGVFKNAEIKHKKIVLLEILGLLHADGHYDEKERSFVKEYASKIELVEADVDLHSGLIDKYLGLVKEMYNAIQ